MLGTQHHPSWVLPPLPVLGGGGTLGRRGEGGQVGCCGGVFAGCQGGILHPAVSHWDLPSLGTAALWRMGWHELGGETLFPNSRGDPCQHPHNCHVQFPAPLAPTLAAADAAAVANEGETRLLCVLAFP